MTKITDSDLGTASVATVVMKTEDPGKAVTIFSSGGPTVDPGLDPKKKSVSINADVDYDTYIRWNVTANDTGGKMDFHIMWRPLTDDGFIEAVLA